MRLSHKKLQKSLHNDVSVKWNTTFITLGVVRMAGTAMALYAGVLSNQRDKAIAVWAISQIFPVIVSIWSSKLYVLFMAVSVVVAAVGQILSPLARLRKCESDCLFHYLILSGGLIYVCAAIMSIFLQTKAGRKQNKVKV